MVCYLPGTGTLAAIGFAIYVFWHQAILHFFVLVGLAAEVALLLGTSAAVAIALIWTARMIRRRRAQAGACTTCRFRCQEALQGRPNLLVNRVDRRTAPAAPIRPVTRTCHPAAPLLPALRRPSRPVPAFRPSPASRPAPASASRLSPASRPSPVPRPAPVSPPVPVPAPRPAVPAAERWPLAPRPTPATQVPSPVETVAFDGYVLTPDGVDSEPAPATEY
jgi:hypothetical protein